jgi:hypothetical protein
MKKKPRKPESEATKARRSGGIARARSLDARRRSEIAQKAARARWARSRPTKGTA